MFNDLKFILGFLFDVLFIVQKQYLQAQKFIR